MKKLLTFVLLLIVLTGCHQDTRVRTKRTFEPLPKVQQERVSKWEWLAKYLKATHPEWPQSVEEITAELEYQEMLEEQKRD